jgi:ferrochelatase
MPEIRMQKNYHHTAIYRKGLAGSVKAFWRVNGQADALLLSFHGIPERFVRLGDPYERHCRETAANLAADLGLTEDQVFVSFQPMNYCKSCLVEGLKNCRCYVRHSRQTV